MNFLNLLAMGINTLGFNLRSNGSMTSGFFRQPLSTDPIHCQLKQPAVASELQQTPPAQIPQSKQYNPNCSTDQPQNLLEEMVSNFRKQLILQQSNLMTQCLTLIQKTSEQGATSKTDEPAAKESPAVPSVSRKKMYLYLDSRSKVNLVCGHENRQHYAKGLCGNCYRRVGRTKKPWKCNHEKLYAAGLCQNCYTNQYNKMKRQKSHNPQELEEEINVHISETSNPEERNKTLDL